MLYEIIVRNDGKEYVAYTTTSRRDAKEKFSRCADSRLRVNGRVLSICEAIQLCGQANRRPVVMSRSNAHAIAKVDEQGNVLERYRTVKDAAAQNGISEKSVYTAYTKGRAVKGMYFREIGNA